MRELRQRLTALVGCTLNLTSSGGVIINLLECDLDEWFAASREVRCIARPSVWNRLSVRHPIPRVIEDQ